MDITLPNLPDIDSKIYKDIYLNVATKCGPVKKRETGIVGCKSSQIIYIIISLLWNTIIGLTVPESVDLTITPKLDPYTKQIIDFAEKVNRLYDICTSSRFSDIQDFSIYLKPIRPFIEIANTDFLDVRSHGNIIYTMGLVFTNNNNKDTHPYGIIFHYFLIIKTNSKFYIISSYGSDFVLIPQKITELNLRDFQNIINAFNRIGTIPERNDIINIFFQKYFLSDGRTRYSIDQGTEKKQVFKPEKGANLEISDYYFKETTEEDQKEYKFFYFPEFVNNINQIIKRVEDETFGGRKIKKTKKNKKSRKNKKSKKSKKNKKSRKNKKF